VPSERCSIEDIVDIVDGRVVSSDVVRGDLRFQDVEAPRLQDNLHMMVSMKNPSDTTGNRTRDIPTCSTVPQPTAPPLTPYYNRPTYIYPKVSLLIVLIFSLTKAF
jgi:hypothetical protein